MIYNSLDLIQKRSMCWRYAIIVIIQKKINHVLKITFDEIESGKGKKKVLN